MLGDNRPAADDAAVIAARLEAITVRLDGVAGRVDRLADTVDRLAERIGGDGSQEGRGNGPHEPGS